MIATHCHPFLSFQKIIEFLLNQPKICFLATCKIPLLSYVTRSFYNNLWWIPNALLMCSSISHGRVLYLIASCHFNSKIKYTLTEILNRMKEIENR